ncbi:hypothetical protein X798_01134 [Onchocerca flexuosa]|uniref:Uncharacterized protein n=1 Tax=Onchocerca flexuosa TaxID=387005 RepID=A0A238C3B6_9BILA|nr:hypothetical protein X798_01134 [Onchocerca flexuosa]
MLVSIRENCKLFVTFCDFLRRKWDVVGGRLSPLCYPLTLVRFWISMTDLILQCTLDEFNIKYWCSTSRFLGKKKNDEDEKTMELVPHNIFEKLSDSSRSRTGFLELLKL